MKNIILILLLFSSSLAFCQTEVKPSIPDTLNIQYLSSRNEVISDFHAKSFASELSKDSIQHQLIFLKSDDKVRYVVKVYGENRLNAIDIIKKSFGDAYYIDKKGWRLNL